MDLIFQTFLHGMEFTQDEAIELLDKLILIHSIVYKKKD